MARSKDGHRSKRAIIHQFKRNQRRGPGAKNPDLERMAEHDLGLYKFSEWSALRKKIPINVHQRRGGPSVAAAKAS